MPIEKLKFKSVEEQQQALAYAESQIVEADEIGEDIDIDKYIKENSDKIESIMEAEINPEAPEWKPPEEGDEPKKEPETTVGQTPTNEVKTEPKVPETNFELETAKRAAAKMQQEYDAELKRRDEELARFKAETDEKIKALQPAEKNEPIVDPDTDRLIQEKSLALKNIVTDIEGLDEDNTEEFVKLAKKQAKIQLDLEALKDKKTQAIINDAQEKLKKMSEIAKEQQKQAEEDRKKREEREKQDALTAQQKAASEKAVTRIESFRNSTEGLKGGRPYIEMESDYIDFASKVAAIYFDKLPNETTTDERDEAYTKYAKGVPALVEKLQANNIKPPADLDKYLILSDINSIYSGEEFDYETGKWNPVLNDQGVKVGAVSMKAAYKYYLDKNGKTEADIRAREKQIIENFKKATETRTPAVELTHEMQGGGNETMTQEAAIKLINETDEDMIMRIKDKGEDMNDMEKIMWKKYNEALTLVTGATV